MREVLFITNVGATVPEQAWIDLIQSFVDYNVTVENRINVAAPDFVGKDLAVISADVLSASYDIKSEAIPTLVLGRTAAVNLYDIGSGTTSGSLDSFNLVNTSVPSLLGTYSSVSDIAVVYSSSQTMHGIDGLGAGVTGVWSNLDNSGRFTVATVDQGGTLADASSAAHRRVFFGAINTFNPTDLTDVANPSGGEQLFFAALDYTYAANLQISDTVFSDAAQTVPYTSANLKYWAMSTTTDLIVSNGTVDPDGSGNIQIADAALIADEYLVTYESSDDTLLGVEVHTVT